MSNYLEEHGYYAYLDAAIGTLKECPLYKGKAKYIAGSHFGFDEEWGRIRCDDCCLELRVKLYGCGNYDPLHAFDAWNTRAERTCHPIEKFSEGSPWPYFACSECGRPLHYDDIVNEVGEDTCEMQPYCGCGAKVVRP